MRDRRFDYTNRHQPDDDRGNEPHRSHQHGAAGADFASAKLIALRMDVSVTTVYRWALVGNIHKFKVGGKVLFDPVQVRDFIRAHRVPR